MSAAAFFDAARALKRELIGASAGLTQDEVEALNSIILKWGADKARQNPTALSDAAAFFASVRKTFGALTEGQVEGLERLLQAYGVARWPIAYAAYGLATGWRETNKTMQPVREAYWLGEAWRKQHLTYWPWYGRGDVQLTWQRNYERADEELGLSGALIADPDVALRPDVSARVMVHGMEGGWFSGKRLADYLPLSGRAGFDAYKQARRIINGTDAWEEIAKNAQAFEAALEAGGWR